MNRRPNRSGSVQQQGQNWYASVTGPDGRRLRFRLGKGLSRAMAEEKAAALSERAQDPVKWAEVLRRRDANRTTQPGEPAWTVRRVGEAWTSGALYEQHGAVNRLRPKVSAKIDAWTLAKHVYAVKTRGPQGPSFGDLPVDTVTSDDVAKVMAAQPKEHAAQTRLHIYQRLRRLFDLAEIPCKLRPESSNPVKRHYRPERDPDKHYSFLYPSEVLALLACTKIPIGRRIFYLLAVYWGSRKGSLFSLKWSGLDFDHGMVSMLKVKGKAPLAKRKAASADVGGRPLYFKADPSCVLTVLRAWRALCGNPAGDTPVIRDIGCEPSHDEAKVLREDLRLAGITRALLFSDAENVQVMRFHDLRATFCTWARRAGYADFWITERTGHRPAGRMLDRYTRQAQTLLDLDYKAFPDVTHAIPELAPPPRPGDGGSTPAGSDGADDGAEDPAVHDPPPQPAAVGARRTYRQPDIAGLDVANGSEPSGAIPADAAEGCNPGRNPAIEVLAGNSVGVQVPPFAPRSQQQILRKQGPGQPGPCFRLCARGFELWGVAVGCCAPSRRYPCRGRSLASLRCAGRGPVGTRETPHSSEALDHG